MELINFWRLESATKTNLICFESGALEAAAMLRKTSLTTSEPAESPTTVTISPGMYWPFASLASLPKPALISLVRLVIPILIDAPRVMSPYPVNGPASAGQLTLTRC